MTGEEVDGSEFVVGCDLDAFRKYYGSLEPSRGGLGATEELIIKQDPSHLIVWRDGDEILGHAIWHESNTREHRKGDSRDEEDRALLERLLGARKDFVELHEVWLRAEHRGKGYGKKFFEFFEWFVAGSGFDSIVYYADHPAALATCRKRGYKEAFGATSPGRTYYVFYLPLK